MPPRDVSIYVLSVRSFKDRIESIEQQSRKLGFNFEFIFDYDAIDLDEDDLVGFDQSALTVPAISLVYKHIEAEKRFLRSSSKYCLVFEDDVILNKDFLDRLEAVLQRVSTLPRGFLVFFGGMDNYVDQRFSRCPSENDLVEKKISTAEGYLTDRVACQKRLAYIDQMDLISRGADHLLQYVDKEVGIQQYWTCKPMLYQGSLTGKFKTELDSSRGKYPSFYIWLRFHYQKIRRNTARRVWHYFKSLITKT